VAIGTACSLIGESSICSSAIVLERGCSGPGGFARMIGEDHLMQVRLAAILEASYLSDAGREQLRISRLQLSSIGSQLDRSPEPAFTDSRPGHPMSAHTDVLHGAKLDAGSVNNLHAGLDLVEQPDVRCAERLVHIRTSLRGPPPSPHRGESLYHVMESRTKRVDSFSQPPIPRRRD
jgi:hypothetical protein